MSERTIIINKKNGRYTIMDFTGKVTMVANNRHLPLAMDLLERYLKKVG